MDEIDHKTVIASLSRDQREGLLRRSDAKGLLHFAVHFCTILITGALIASDAFLWPALLPIQGILIIFLFTAEHETIHDTAFRTGWLNDAVATVCGFLVFLPPAWFRYFHFAHHRFTQDIDRDPELMTAKPARMSEYWIYLSGFPLWRAQLGQLFINAAGKNDDSFVSAKRRARVQSEARWFLVVYASSIAGSILLTSDLLLWVWIVPVLIGQPFLRAYLLAEHGGCPVVANMLANSRTTFTNPLIKFLTWNMPYHAEHHAYPAVPFHKLPAFHALVRDHLEVTENGYVRFHQKYVAAFDEPAA